MFQLSLKKVLNLQFETLTKKMPAKRLLLK